MKPHQVAAVIIISVMFVAGGALFFSPDYEARPVTPTASYAARPGTTLVTVPAVSTTTARGTSTSPAAELPEVTGATGALPLRPVAPETTRVTIAPTQPLPAATAPQTTIPVTTTSPVPGTQTPTTPRPTVTIPVTHPLGWLPCLPNTGKQPDGYDVIDGAGGCWLKPHKPTPTTGAPTTTGTTTEVTDASLSGPEGTDS